jgi:hypothetical protein
MGDEELYRTLSSETLSVLILDTKKVVEEIKVSVSGIGAWKNRIQGALGLLALIVVTTAGFAWSTLSGNGIKLDALKEEVTTLKVEQKHQDGDNTTILNQLSIVRSDGQSNAKASQIQSETLSKLQGDEAKLEERVSQFKTEDILSGRKSR